MYRKLTNESLWNTTQLRGVEKEELYWVAEALKGMAGRENTDTHNILVLADWIFAYNEEGELTLPFDVDGLILRPGNPPALINNRTVQGSCIVIGHRKP